MQFNRKNHRARLVEKAVLMDLRIEKMVQGGEGLARLPDGRVCFVAGALPGELCRVQVTSQKKDFARGRVVNVLEPSPDRVEPRCPLFGRCGGCSLQHLASERQAAYLEQVERDNFKRLSHVELPADFKVHTGAPWGYRNRARVVKCGRGFGFREQESNETVAFADCPVLTPALNEFLRGEGRALVDRGEGGNRPEVRELNIFDSGSGRVAYYYRGMPADEFAGNAVSRVEICGHRIETDASVFFQSNLGLLPKLVEFVCNAVDEGIAGGEASDDWLIDLFSGVGFFAAILQDRFKRVTTVERDEGCLAHARVNLAPRKDSPAPENVSAPAEEWLLHNVVDVPATLIVDPPRTGLPGEAIDAIVESSVKRLVYVSCNPVTLARDYVKFANAGFVLKKAEGFAFYPQTPHLEMAFILSRP